MARAQLDLTFGTIRNSELFSNHWFQRRLPMEPEWQDERPHAAAILDQLAALWQAQSGLIANYNEAQLEDKFIKPILAALGWQMLPQPALDNRTPDYALFLTAEAYHSAVQADPRSPDFWQYPALVADAKAAHVSLDHPTGSGTQREFPPQQIEWYLDRSRLDYAILTNGRLWRLIPRQRSTSQPRFQTYLECDLATLLTRRQQAGLHQQFELADDFLRFYLFFSPYAYQTLPDRDPLIRRAVEGSNLYRVSASEGLKDRVFEALRLSIEGFLGFSANALDPAQDLPLCRENAFTLLYRMLFIFFAEDRQLLPYRKNQLYTENRSLGRFRDDIATRLDKIERHQLADFSRAETRLWRDLVSLFNLIDNGKADYGVPAYNGGLFNTDDHPFLKTKALPDWYLARVIDALGRAADPHHADLAPFSVDYKDLAIQDLGNIYEGLLELHPHYASAPMRIIRARRASPGQRPEERVIPQDAPVPEGFEPTREPCPTGTIYLLNDKGERRASGSYYTPDHIVDYIVEKTLGPLAREIDQNLNAEIAAAEQALKGTRGTTRAQLESDLARLRGGFDDRILALRVVDPAMGSGHFLLRACQYLAEEIATNPHTSDPAAADLTGDESTVIYWKRKVVETCLYGVDLNPVAVELAKLALWLVTVSTTQPLSFLNHHLRHGNALVGAQVRDLALLPGAKEMYRTSYENLIAQRMPRLLGSLDQIRRLPSDTVEQVKQKETVYERTIKPVRQPFIDAADLWCAAFFAPQPLQPNVQTYDALVKALDKPARFNVLAANPPVQQAIAAVRAPSVRAFHWELEFPDVFFDERGMLANPGFHGVIGNPPYDVLSEKENKTDLSALQGFIKAQARYAPSVRGKNNLYKLFICQALNLLRQEGRMGFITPMAILGDDQAADVRRAIIESGAFRSVDAFPQKDDPEQRVFHEAKLSTAVFSILKTSGAQRAAQFAARVHPAQWVAENSPGLMLSTAEIPAYDPVNLTVVACAQVDWDLAIRVVRSERMVRLGGFTDFFQGEVNETNERAKGNLLPALQAGQLVTRGASICLYVARAASQGEDLYLNVAKFLAGKSADAKAFHYKHRRVALQESCPQNNFRRVIACLLPAGQFCNHTINYLPEHQTRIPLEFVLAALNTKFIDWYFRLGSTNAHVSHYQIGNLPVPRFADAKSDADIALRHAAEQALQRQDFAEVLRTLSPATAAPPFSLAIRDIIIVAVEKIIALETRRGAIARTERSHLAPAAQPYQDLIDQLFYRLAGLTPAESAALETRLAAML